MSKLVNIFKQYKRELSWIYLFMMLAEMSFLATPFLLGKTIDGLIAGNWYWLILLGISYAISNFFFYKRMIYDTKIYTTIYNDIALTFLKKNNVDVSTKIARTDMAHDIVGVLEGHVHYYVATIITIIGSLIFIYTENWRVGVLVSIATFFVTGAVFILYKKIKQAITVRNDHHEKKATAIENGYLSAESFFLRRRRIEIYDSTIQGKNWFLANSVKYIFLLISIVLLVTTTKNITIGSVITVYSYVNNFLIALMSAPIIVEMCLRMTDILKRIE